MDDHTLQLLSYPKATSTTCVTRLRTLFRLYAYRPKPVVCTASEGLVDKLPPELIAHILIVGVLDAGDLARCAAVCRALARTVSDPANDVALWKIACDRRWAQMVLNPAECYRDELAGLSYKMRYRWAEADGQRRRGAVEDLLRVEVRRPPWATSAPAAPRLISPALPPISPQAWDVKFIRRAPYRIDNFPYRCVHTPRGRQFVYRSPTFGHELRSYQLAQARLATYVQVDGIPEVKMVRRADWGWELRNALWVASSVRHCAVPRFDLTIVQE